MSNITFQITSGQAPRRTLRSLSTILLVGWCTASPSSASNIAPVPIAPNQDAYALLGRGPLAARAAQAASRLGCRVIALPVPLTTKGTIGAITKSNGSGPTITAAAYDTNTGPYGSYPSIVVKVLTTGALGVARIGVAFDGSTFTRTYDVPDEAAAVLTGTVDLVGLTLSSLNTTTLDTTGIVETITFTTPASVDAIATQLNAAYSLIDASIVTQGAKKFARLTSQAKGSSATFTIDPASTADTVLGLTGTATGSASTVLLEDIGVVLTFPSGTYTAGDTYTFATTAPVFEVANLSTYVTKPNTDPTLAWGVTALAQEPADANDTAFYFTTLDALRSAWEGQANKRFGVFYMGAPLDLSDTSLKAALLGKNSPAIVCCAGDTYTVEQAGVGGAGAPGTHRRSAQLPCLIRRGTIEISRDIGDGALPVLPECSAVGPDGATLARSEDTATVKLGDFEGPGFTVLVADGVSQRVDGGITRAVGDLVFIDEPTAMVRAAVATLIFEELKRYKNGRFLLNKNGTMRSDEAIAIDSSFNRLLTDEFVSKGHVSAAAVKVDRSVNMATTKSIVVEYDVQTLGYGRRLTGKLSFAGTLVEG